MTMIDTAFVGACYRIVGSPSPKDRKRSLLYKECVRTHVPEFEPVAAVCRLAFNNLAREHTEFAACGLYTLCFAARAMAEHSATNDEETTGPTTWATPNNTETLSCATEKTDQIRGEGGSPLQRLDPR